jgi:DNA-binding GntR family transcriptional regulator
VSATQYSLRVRNAVYRAVAKYRGLPVSSHDVREETGLSNTTVRHVLRLLVAFGRLKRKLGRPYLYFVEES